MRILLDECMPRQLNKLLAPHQALTVRQMHWDGVKNGDLLNRAEHQIAVLLTVDRNMEYQQNWSNRRIAEILLDAPGIDVPSLRPLMPEVLALLEEIQPGAFVRIG